MMFATIPLFMKRSIPLPREIECEGIQCVDFASEDDALIR